MNLAAVVRLVGINENTLRAWERRYNAVTPERDPNGRRTYSSDEVEKIRLLWALVNEGHSIGLIANNDNSTLKMMLAGSLSPQLATLTNVKSDNNNAQKFLASIVSALDKFNLEGLHHNLQRARFEMSIKEIVIDLIRPLMKEVGRMSEVGRLSISQEHLLSSLLRDYLGNIHQSLSPYDFSARNSSKKVILTTREGDLHEFTILMAAILSNVYQFQTYYLGSNMPVLDLIQSCIRFNPDFLILGFTPLPPNREIITPKDYLIQLDRNVPRKVTFCLGGPVDLDSCNLSNDRLIKSLTGLSDLDQFLASKSIT